MRRAPRFEGPSRSLPAAPPRLGLFPTRFNEASGEPTRRGNCEPSFPEFEEPASVLRPREAFHLDVFVKIAGVIDVREVSQR